MRWHWRTWSNVWPDSFWKTQKFHLHGYPSSCQAHGIQSDHGPHTVLDFISLCTVREQEKQRQRKTFWRGGIMKTEVLHMKQWPSSENPASAPSAQVNGACGDPIGAALPERPCSSPGPHPQDRVREITSHTLWEFKSQFTTRAYSSTPYITISDVSAQMSLPLLNIVWLAWCSVKIFLEPFLEAVKTKQNHLSAGQWLPGEP